MRYRSTDLRQSQTYYRYFRSTCSGGYTQSTSSKTDGVLKEIWDCQSPDYFKTLARGGVLPYLPVTIKTQTADISPFSFTRTRVTGTGSPCQAGYGDLILDDSYTNDVSSLPSPDPAKISYVMNAAIASAKSEAFDALTAVAELGKTGGMIANRIGSVFNIATKASRKALREKGLRRQLETFNSLWLEARYGWRPLIHDIENACEQLQKQKFSINRRRSQISESLDASSAPKVTTASLDIWTGTASRVGTRTYTGFALAVGTFGSAPEFRPIQTGWELIPFSFVVDWFFDVGSYLSAITPIPGVDIRASGYSIKDDYVISKSVSAVTNTAQSTYTLSMSAPYQYELDVKAYSRYPSAAISPSFLPRLNTLKLIDIGALVFQRALPLSRFLTKR